MSITRNLIKIVPRSRRRTSGIESVEVMDLHADDLDAMVAEGVEIEVQFKGDWKAANSMGREEKPTLVEIPLALVKKRQRSAPV